MSVARALAKVKPHIPLIKFRKGLDPNPSVSQVEASVVESMLSNPVLEFWELPHKYKKPALSDKEIDAINQGGGDVVPR